MPILNYWVSGNTAEGFVDFLDENLNGIEQIVTLQHPSASLKSQILGNLVEHYQEESLEILKSALGDQYLDGIIIRDKSVAILDEAIARNGTSTINLEGFFPSSPQDLSDFYMLTQKAYDSFDMGLKIHDDLEEVYINEMDFNRADQFTDEFVTKLLADIPQSENTGQTFNRFFGTNTADGIVNVVPHLKEAIKNVNFIKGRAGTGKSTFMKKVAEACTDCGFDVEMYHCSFDPNSIDMVLVRELDFCLFDSTDPHEFFPERDGEVIVDLYDELVTPGTDEKFAAEITELNNRYKSFMKEGNSYLKDAGVYLEKVEQNYSGNLKDEDVKSVSSNILKII